MENALLFASSFWCFTQKLTLSWFTFPHEQNHLFFVLLFFLKTKLFKKKKGCKLTSCWLHISSSTGSHYWQNMTTNTRKRRQQETIFASFSLSISFFLILYHSAYFVGKDQVIHDTMHAQTNMNHQLIRTVIAELPLWLWSFYATII